MDHFIHLLVATYTFYKNISERVRVKLSDALFYKKVTQRVITTILQNFGHFWAQDETP